MARDNDINTQIEKIQEEMKGGGRVLRLLYLGPLFRYLC